MHKVTPRSSSSGAGWRDLWNRAGQDESNRTCYVDAITHSREGGDGPSKHEHPVRRPLLSQMQSFAARTSPRNSPPTSNIWAQSLNQIE